MPIGIQLKDFHFVFHKVGGSVIHFELSDDLAKAGDATIHYYGYLAENGAWIIMENDTDEGTYRYVAGASLYAANWTARESQTYGLYSSMTIEE